MGGKRPRVPVEIEAWGFVADGARNLQVIVGLGVVAKRDIALVVEHHRQFIAQYRRECGIARLPPHREDGQVDAGEGSQLLRPGPGSNHQSRRTDCPAGMGLHRHGLVRGGVKADDLILEPGTPQLPGAFDKPLQGPTRIEIAVTASIYAPDNLLDAQMRYQFTDVLWREELDLDP